MLCILVATFMPLKGFGKTFASCDYYTIFIRLQEVRFCRFSGKIEEEVLKGLLLRLLYHNFIAQGAMGGVAVGATAPNYDKMFSLFPRQRDKSAFRRFTNSFAVCF